MSHRRHGGLPARLRRLPWRQIGRFAAFGALGLYGLYVLGAWAFLSLGGLERMTRNEKDAHVLTGGGYSFWPGYIHVRDLRVRFQDYNVEMEIAVDSATAFIALWEMPFMRVHLHWARAEGVEYRMTHRVHDAAAARERLARFPHIEGFDRPQYYDAPPPPPNFGKQWIIEIDSVDAEARLAWALEYQLRGKLRARGGFRLDPLNAATIHDCTLDIVDGTVTSGPDAVLSRVQGQLFTQIDTFYPPDSPFDVVLPRMSAGLRHLRAHVDSLEVVPMYAKDLPLSVTGNGELTAEFALDHGQIHQGSRAEVHLPALRWAAKSSHVVADTRLGLAAPTSGAFQLQIDAALDEAADNALNAKQVTGVLGFEHDTLLDATIAELDVHVRQLSWKDRAFLRALLAKSGPLLPLSGEFDINVEAKAPRSGEGAMDGEFQARRVNFLEGDLRFGVTAKGKIHCRGSRERATCSAAVHAPYALFDRTPSAGGHAVWMRVHTKKDAVVSLNQGTIEAELVCAGGDPKPVARELIGDDFFGQFGLTLIPTGPIQGKARLSRDARGLALRVPDLAFGSTHVSGGLLSMPNLHGAWLLEMPALNLGLELEPSGISVKPLASRDWLKERGFTTGDDGA